MINRRIVTLTDIGFEQPGEEWQRLEATISLDEESAEDNPELELEIKGVTIAIPVQDIFDCLEYLGVDLQAWIDKSA